MTISQMLASFLSAAIRVAFPVEHASAGHEAMYARCQMDYLTTPHAWR
jgi:hypothetical protein